MIKTPISRSNFSPQPYNASRIERALNKLTIMSPESCQNLQKIESKFRLLPKKDNGEISIYPQDGCLLSALKNGFTKMFEEKYIALQSPRKKHKKAIYAEFKYHLEQAQAHLEKFSPEMRGALADTDGNYTQLYALEDNFDEIIERCENAEIVLGKDTGGAQRRESMSKNMIYLLSKEYTKLSKKNPICYYYIKYYKGEFYDFLIEIENQVLSKIKFNNILKLSLGTQQTIGKYASEICTIQNKNATS